MRCGLWECENRAVLKAQNGDYYCSDACALSDIQGRGANITSVLTEKLTTGELTALSEASKRNWSTIESDMPTKPIEKERMPESESSTGPMLNTGENMTERNHEQPTGRTSNYPEQEKSKDIAKNILTPELQPPSGNSDVVKSLSTNLIDESLMQLHDLMTFVSDSLRERSSGTPVMTKGDPNAINAACNCAKQMAALMKMKLEFKKLEAK